MSSQDSIRLSKVHCLNILAPSQEISPQLDFNPPVGNNRRNKKTGLETQSTSSDAQSQEANTGDKNSLISISFDQLHYFNFQHYKRIHIHY